MILKVSEILQCCGLRKLFVCFTRWVILEWHRDLFKFVKDVGLEAGFEWLENFTIRIFCGHLGLWIRDKYKSCRWRSCDRIIRSKLLLHVLLFIKIFPKNFVLLLARAHLRAHEPVGKVHVHFPRNLSFCLLIMTRPCFSWNKLIAELLLVENGCFFRNGCDKDSCKHTPHKEWSQSEGACKVWNFLGGCEICKYAHHNSECAAPFAHLRS